MRKLLFLSLLTVLGVSAASPAPPPPPGQGTACGQTEVGVKKREDARGLTLSVVTSCDETKRTRWFFAVPFINTKCDVLTRNVRFERTPDGKRDVRVIGRAPAQNCCGGTVDGLIQVEQVCR